MYSNENSWIQSKVFFFFKLKKCILLVSTWKCVVNRFCNCKILILENKTHSTIDLSLKSVYKFNEMGTDITISIQQFQFCLLNMLRLCLSGDLQYFLCTKLIATFCYTWFGFLSVKKSHYFRLLMHGLSFIILPYRFEMEIKESLWITFSYQYNSYFVVIT